MTDIRPQLRALLANGAGTPAARDLATTMLRIADRRHAERRRFQDWCTSGCSAPVVTTEPEPLCAKCAKDMLR